MDLPAPATIANRFGRIVCATALGSLLITLTGLPEDVWYNSAPGLTEPLSLYIHVLIGSMAEFVLMIFVVPATYLLFWGLSRRLSRATVWRLLAVGSVVLVVGLSFSEGPYAPTEIAMSIWSGVVFATAVLASIGTVEVFAGTGVVRPVSTTTLVGTVFLAVAVITLGVVALSTAGVVVADHAGYAVTAEDRYEADLETEREIALDEADDGEPTPEYTDVPGEYISLADDSDGHHLLEHDDPGPPDGNASWTSYEPVKTHTGTEYFEAESIELETENGTETVEGHYHLEFDPGYTAFEAEALEYGATDAEKFEYDGGRYSAPGFQTGTVRADGTVRMESTESMWVYYDIVNSDGEVERYMTFLERGDVE